VDDTPGQLKFEEEPVSYSLDDQIGIELFSQEFLNDSRDNPDPKAVAKFQSWAWDNFECITLCLRMAQKRQAEGDRRYSVSAIMQGIRWDRLDVQIETTDEFRLNNDLFPYLSRLLVKLGPSLADFFERRALGSKRK
jgi:hypothetical protein